MVMRCLIVDDSRIFLRAARELLEREGVAVTLASTGSEAHRLVGEADPDVVLVDIDLGEENGFEVVAQMAVDEVAARLILISSHGREDLEELIQESPALGFLSKSALSAAAIRFLLDGDGGLPVSERRGT